MPTAIEAPYLIYFGDTSEISFAKTGLGLIEWRADLCIGQTRLPDCVVDGGLPDLTIDEAKEHGAKSLIIGVAPIGGQVPASWMEDIVAAARAGIHIVSGMHSRLADFPELVEAARSGDAELIDVRTPPKNLPIGSGEKRPGKRLLTVGTDCAVGKKYTALAIEKEMRARGWAADFRATGQTGIMIAGSGIPIDAVVSDFLSGAAELISPAADPDHWDVVEGQGALSHPSYAGVSLGLLHGSQPDALVLCHDASRQALFTGSEAPSFPIQSFQQSMECALLLAHRVNPMARFVGVSVNSSRVPADQRTELLESYALETGLPAVDPILDGVGPIVDRIETEFGA